MKNFLLKTKLITFVTMVLLTISGNAQDIAPTHPIEEIQELMLIEHKISFNSEQMDLNTVKVLAVTEIEKTTAPILTISPEISFITIDFSNCESGEYLITGKKGESEVTYLVKHIK